MKGKSKLKDGEFRYGKVEMTDEEHYESKNPKIRTTMFLDADLIRAYKREAVKKGVKYQQLMREKLRDAMTTPANVETRLRRLERALLNKRTGT